MLQPAPHTNGMPGQDVPPRPPAGGAALEEAWEEYMFCGPKESLLPPEDGEEPWQWEVLDHPTDDYCMPCTPTAGEIYDAYALAAQAMLSSSEDVGEAFTHTLMAGAAPETLLGSRVDSWLGPGYGFQPDKVSEEGRRFQESSGEEGVYVGSAPSSPETEETARGTLRAADATTSYSHVQASGDQRERCESEHIPVRDLTDRTLTQAR